MASVPIVPGCGCGSISLGAQWRSPVDPSLLELAAAIEAFVQHHDPCSKQELQQHFQLSETACDQTLHWLAAHGHLTLEPSGDDTVIRASWHEE
jgi:hypothetical protein